MKPARPLQRVLPGLLLSLVTAGTASAELRTVRGLGAAPVPPGRDEPLAVLRDRAVHAALRDAVVGVAEEVVAGTPGVSPVLTPEELLAPDLERYVPSYRILEDRGVIEGGPLAASRPGPHYLVLVEATVDVSAIRRVVSRSLPAGAEPPRPLRVGPPDPAASPEGAGSRPGSVLAVGPGDAGLRVVIEEARSYPAVQAVRRLLVEDLGAAAARPVVWEPGRVVLEVDVPFDGPALAARLRGLAPGDLAVDVLEAAPSLLRIRATLRRSVPDEGEGRAVPRFPD